MIRAEVVDTVRAWLGTPFIPQQSRRGVGCDCAGLVLGVARDLGIVAPDFRLPTYRQQPNGSMLKLCDEHLIRLSRGSQRAGDVVVMRFQREPQHLGILVPYRDTLLAVVHALMTSERVVEHRLDARWTAFVTAAYAFPGVVD